MCTAMDNHKSSEMADKGLDIHALRFPFFFRIFVKGFALFLSFQPIHESFLPPYFLLAEEEQGACSSLPQASTEDMFVETGSYNTNRCTRRTQVMRSPKQSLDSREDDSGRINGWKGGASDHINCMTRESRSSSRPVSRKLNYGEDEEGDYSYGCEDSYPSYEGDNIIYDKEGDEEESIYWIPVPHQMKSKGEIRYRRLRIVGQCPLNQGSSNQSDDSAGSFAFPVLRWEGIGSPVQMPKSEDLQLRKHKARGWAFIVVDSNFLGNPFGLRLDWR
ncbi:hypothetical protein CK203_107820 [Vitis vinifera]|uniref:Uncharacterized protein n=1 Tax=Vitis vinifera TaxID=29760 RepID=A0A438CBS1_VITVI|nr:hypothetical protein CK203_107820 [Vitis vinifera]